MNFIVSSSELLNHIQVVSKVISSKNTLPILDNFLFELKDNELSIRAADLETTLITRLEVSGDGKDGKIAVPAKILTDTLREFPDQPLKFEIDESTLGIEILTENGKYNIVGQESEDFPMPHELDADTTIRLTVNTDLLLSGVNKTLFATADDEMRPVMNGIFMKAEENALTFVASDAHKLVKYKRTDIETDVDASFILHKKPAALLKNILPKKDVDINILFDNKYAVFDLPKYTLICCLVEGTYPAYESVIPLNNDKKITVDRVDLYNALKRVAVFSNQSSNLVKMSLTENSITISAQDIDFSISAYEKIHCSYEGEEIEIGFKSTFLIELINNISSSNMSIELSQVGHAGIFLPYEKEYEDEEILMLLMPMSL